MYYLEAIRRLVVIPILLRCDHGTENSTISFLQPFSGTYYMSCLKVSSVFNQRIEGLVGNYKTPKNAVMDFFQRLKG